MPKKKKKGMSGIDKLKQYRGGRAAKLDEAMGITPKKKKKSKKKK